MATKKIKTNYEANKKWFEDHAFNLNICGDGFAISSITQKLCLCSELTKPMCMHCHFHNGPVYCAEEKAKWLAAPADGYIDSKILAAFEALKQDDIITIKTERGKEVAHFSALEQDHGRYVVRYYANGTSSKTHKNARQGIWGANIEDVVIGDATEKKTKKGEKKK